MATNHSVFSPHARFITGKLPTTINTEESNKSTVTSLSSVNKVITHSMEKLSRQIKTAYIVSDGCASQFRSHHVFSFLTHIHPDITTEWNYNEAHHGTGLMDGIGDTVNNLVYCRVLSGDELLTLLENSQNLQIKLAVLIV